METTIPRTSHDTLPDTRHSGPPDPGTPDLPAEFVRRLRERHARLDARTAELLIEEYGFPAGEWY